MYIYLQSHITFYRKPSAICTAHNIPFQMWLAPATSYIQLVFFLVVVSSSPKMRVSYAIFSYFSTCIRTIKNILMVGPPHPTAWSFSWFSAKAYLVTYFLLQILNLRKKMQMFSQLFAPRQSSSKYCQHGQ